MLQNNCSKPILNFFDCIGILMRIQNLKSSCFNSIFFLVVLVGYSNMELEMPPKTANAGKDFPFLEFTAKDG